MEEKEVWKKEREGKRPSDAIGRKCLSVNSQVVCNAQTGLGLWKEYDYEDDWTKLPTSQIVLLGNSGKASYWLTLHATPPLPENLFQWPDPNSHVHTVAPRRSSGRRSRLFFLRRMLIGPVTDRPTRKKTIQIEKEFFFPLII